MMWIIFAIVTAAAILVVTRPIGQKRLAVRNADLDVYKLQLSELERDAERGTIDPKEIEQTRLEISRRLLKANRRATLDADDATSASSASGPIFIAIAAFMAVASVGLYMQLGRPGLPDQPLHARLNAPVEAQPLNIQVANVERRLRTNPNDEAGWSVIAPIYFRLGDYDKSANAYQKVIALRGPSEDRLLGMAEALTFSNGGTIPDPAKQAFKLAVQMNPKSLRGRFWLALAAEQDGQTEEASTVYRTMLSENLPEMWRNVAQGRLNALTGQDRSGDDKNSVLQGDQGAMIQAMVESLATRLQQNGNDLQGWLRLIRSYMVLKEEEKAEGALNSARKQFASDTASLKQIDELAKQYRLGQNAQTSQ